MQHKYHSILDTHPELICRFGPDFALSYVNRMFAKFFNGSAESFIGKSLFEIVQQKQHGPLHQKLASLSPEEARVTINSTRVKGDGTEVHLEWIIIALFDEFARLTEYQSLGRDVTQQKELTLELETRNKSLEIMQSEMRIVLDAMPCKVWYKDDENKILKLNAMAAESMGLDVESAEGQNTYDLFGDAAKAYHDDDLKVINTGKPMLGIVERYTPNEGDPAWVQTDKIPFNDPHTGENRILVVSTDITELKEKEALLKSINKNLDDFASLTSHDLQAPLRHISVFAELLEAEHGQDISDEGKAYIAKITDGVENMHALIRSFLKFMRSSPGSVELDPVNLSSVIDHVALLNKSDLKACGGTITCPKDLVFVRGDRALLTQVIGNLVENAIKYRDHAVPINIDISASKRQGQWHIHIADNGAGIDKSFAPYVFDLFGRSKRHANREGTGIGLALCQRIITLHGGTIALNTDREKGSEFIFSLNAASAKI